MTMSPSSLLAKLDELKQWQQLQQERLLKQHQARLEAANELFPHLAATIADVSSTNYKGNVPASTRLENISYEEEKSDGKQQHPGRFDNLIESPENDTKRPFLKRGTGLVKYGLQYGDHKKPFNKMKAPKVHKTVFHKRLEQIRRDEAQTQQQRTNEKSDVKVASATVPKEQKETLPKSKQFNVSRSKAPNSLLKDVKPVSKSPTEITPLRAPEVNIKQKAKWCPVEPDDYEPLPSILPSKTQTEATLQHPEDQRNNEEVPNQNLQMEMLQNNPELFQLLQKLASEHFGTPGSNHSLTFDQTDLLNKLTQLENESTLCQTPMNNNNNQLVKYLQDLLRRSDNTPGDLTSYENALEKELRVFEQLEEKAMNSSFCSTNSSVMELLASTPNRINQHKMPTFQTIQEEANKHVQVQAGEIKGKVSIGVQNSFNSSADCTLQSRGSSNAKKMLVYPQMYQAQPETSVRADYSDESSINSDDFETTTANIQIPGRIVRQNACTMTDPLDEVNDELLKVKLEELEAEISSFRTENKKIEKTKSDLERERFEFQRTRKALEKEYNEKRDELECEIAEERKKLMKEKSVFEKYTKDAQNKPNRKEREEISNLKAELAVVKDTLKVKESRNGTTQARLRTQLKSMEKDNAHLKEEIEKLQKVNARLQNQTHLGKKGRQDETKMLHEINKNLTKLTQDQKVVKALTKVDSLMEEKNSSRDSLITLSTSGSRAKTSSKIELKSSKSKKSQPKHSIEVSTDSEDDKNNKNRRQGKVIIVSEEESCDEDEDVRVKSVKSKRRSTDYETEYRRSYSLSRSSYKSDSDEDSRPKSRSRARSSLESRKSLENKENESSNGDITTFRNLSDLSVSENYEKVFGAKGKGLKNVKEAASQEKGEGRQLKRHNSLNDTQQTNSKVESILVDGSKETKYPNGNVKTTSPDGNFVKMEYFNGDIKETALLEGTIKYFYKDTQIWQTTFATGDETFEFPDGQVEKHFSDGSSHVQFPNGIVKHMSADGCEQINYPDGSVVNIKQDGEKVLLLANGQKEIHTEKHKRREYPDGTVKIIYADGLQETRYSNGRIRMKDKDGNLIMDSHKD